LKPGNVMLTPAGDVKVLDFGLAKGGMGSGSSPSDISMSHSPTLTHQHTGAGVILGTAAYMSPEQARGLVVDKRTDIWAFGCVLFEALAGRAPFAGATVTDVRIELRSPVDAASRGLVGGDLVRRKPADRRYDDVRLSHQRQGMVFRQSGPHRRQLRRRVCHDVFAVWQRPPALPPYWSSRRLRALS
jgi:serine/threonine protein kinase